MCAHTRIVINWLQDRIIELSLELFVRRILAGNASFVTY